MSSLVILGLPFLACLLLTVMLGYLGLHVLKRGVIFIDIAVAQVAALGAVVAHVFFHVRGSSVQALACAVGATLLAALFFAVVRRHASRLPIEATIGITYAIMAAGTLFVIGKSACGHTHVQEMLTGSLLWVEWQDLGCTALVFAGVGGVLLRCRRPFQAISDTYHKTAEKDGRTTMWDFLFYALCGIVITFAVRLAGVLVVFCFLIIPATVSAMFRQSWVSRLLVAWAVGIVGSIGGLLFCHWLDFSAGVSVSLFLGICLSAASCIARTLHLRSKSDRNPEVAQA
jgi:zinc/manganese transport system permease protein